MSVCWNHDALTTAVELTHTMVKVYFQSRKSEISVIESIRHFWESIVEMVNKSHNDFSSGFLVRKRFCSQRYVYEIRI